MRKKLFLNDRGMTLIQVVVAMGLMGMLSVGVMQLMDMASTSSKKMQQTFEITELHNKILLFMSQEDEATNNLAGLNPSTQIDITELRRVSDDAIRYQLNTKYGPSKIEIAEMKMGGSFNQLGGDPNFGQVPFEILYRKKIKGKTKTVKRDFDITVRLNGGNIQTAQASSGAGGGSGYWLPNANGIHYSDGNVGIGVAVPDEKLQVDGWIKAKTGYGRNIMLGGDSGSDDYEIRTDSNKPITLWDAANNQTATMIMRALRLTKQAVPHGQACTATEQGQVRFNDTSKTLEACDGGNYKTVGPFINRCVWRHNKKVAADYYNSVNCNAGEVAVSGSCYLPTGAGSSIYASVALTNMGHRCGASGALGTCSRWWCGVTPNAANIEVNALCCSF